MPLTLNTRVRELHWPDRRKQHSNVGQSNSLPIMCILPLQRSRVMCFGLVGSHYQLCTFYTVINLLVTNLFYIHARHRMIEAAWRDKKKRKKGMLQSVPWSVGRSFSDVTSAWLGSPIQPIRRNQQHRSAFLNISSQAKNANHWSVEELFLALK